ncbi:Uncharacterised protein [uncultured Roseburia sp.]|nr:Uncharacterised protein [uncultured Roseburia sp.]
MAEIIEITDLKAPPLSAGCEKDLCSCSPDCGVGRYRKPY